MISVKKAIELDKLEKRLIKEFKEQMQIDEKKEQMKQKSFSPITNALEKLENVLAEQAFLPEIRQNEEIQTHLPQIEGVKTINLGPIAAEYLKKS